MCNIPEPWITVFIWIIIFIIYTFVLGIIIYYGLSVRPLH